jgi:hypothetical protein
MLMVLRLVALVDIALRCDRAIKDVRGSAASLRRQAPELEHARYAVRPKEDDCEAPVCGGRNGGSMLRMRQELREQHNGGTAVLEPRSFRTEVFEHY